MSDSTTPQDDAAMSPASTGSVAGPPLGDPEIAVEILRLRVAELEQAIRRLAEHDATLSVCDGNVTVEMDGTLTYEERAVIQWAVNAMRPECRAVLQGLLDRTK